MSDEKLWRYERFNQGNSQVLYHQSTYQVYAFPCIAVVSDFGNFLKLVEVKNKSFDDFSVFVLLLHQFYTTRDVEY